MNKHTPIPFKVINKTAIISIGAANVTVAHTMESFIGGANGFYSIGAEESQGNAKFIADACNAHESLKAKAECAEKLAAALKAISEKTDQKLTRISIPLQDMICDALAEWEKVK
jgi:hypothetical protein